MSSWHKNITDVLQGEPGGNIGEIDDASAMTADLGAATGSSSSPLFDTCVSSRHSRKCVTLLKFMTELIFFSKLLEHLFSDHFF